jgi:hypothetical protein
VPSPYSPIPRFTSPRRALPLDPLATIPPPYKHCGAGILAREGLRLGELGQLCGHGAARRTLKPVPCPPCEGRAGRWPVAAAVGGRGSLVDGGDEMAIGRLPTSARGRACLKLSPSCPCWRCLPEIEVLAGAGSSSTPGSELSSYSTSAGRGELNNSTITRLRATHRGQCRIASRHGRTSTLRPHRGQFRCSQQILASTCVLVLMSPPTGLGRRRERSATPVVWRQRSHRRSCSSLCRCVHSPGSWHGETVLIGRSDEACDDGLLTRALRRATVQVDAGTPAECRSWKSEPTEV